ncbi:MAG: excinuclease ABC subunit C [Campylobacteraceae bacterium 4484_4]|nr:MAG: excinuclease ABC subunit C [Campylobacteraceae bacterium 4484_4]
MSLLKTLKELPSDPGVYQYFDKEGRLLYIGKAKSLKNRVKSYFRLQPKLHPAPGLTPRIHRMITETAKMEYLIVESEHDALILENSLIKQLKPKYNILLRDDKTYPYLYIDLSQPFPRFEITRKVVKGRQIKYFGPFSTSAKALSDALYDLFPLVQKKGSLKGKKACLFHQIGKCLAPCEGKVSSEEYHRIVLEAIDTLQHRGRLIKRLEEKMQHLAEQLLFEEASRIRDQIETIRKSEILSEVDLARIEDFDIFAVAIEGERACGVRLFIRGGKITSSSHTIVKSDTGFEKQELYEALLLEYYRQPLPYIPKQILLYDEVEDLSLLEEIVSRYATHSVAIKIPKIGEKRRLTELAFKNAQEILRLDASRSGDSILKELKKTFGLQKTPYIIETFDNSHLQGSARVGAMVRWEEEWKKGDYRHYNLEAKDEYAQMREMLTRRCERFDLLPPPDLMVIDGGETLLKLARKIVKQYGVSVDIIAIAKEKRDHKAHRAKGGAKDLIHTAYETFRLPERDRRLQFIQKMRDEAHRFAISFHRRQKRKTDQKSMLLQKRGIGPATVKKLLQYFETFENIEQASFDEIAAVAGKRAAEALKKS